MKNPIQWLLGCVVLAVSATAAAQVAYTSSTVHMRAGPDPQYPIVQIYPGGSAVDVQGCLSDYSWCDVIAGPNRGWVYASYLVYPYQGSNAPVINYGPAMGIAVVSFSVGAYWGSYYHNRPWYSQRSYWNQHPPHYHHRPPPRPPTHGRPPIHGGGHPPPRPPHQGGGRPPQTKPGHPGGPSTRPQHGSGQHGGNNGRPPGNQR